MTAVSKHRKSLYNKEEQSLNIKKFARENRQKIMKISSMSH